MFSRTPVTLPILLSASAMARAARAQGRVALGSTTIARSPDSLFNA